MRIEVEITGDEHAAERLHAAIEREHPSGKITVDYGLQDDSVRVVVARGGRIVGQASAKIWELVSSTREPP